MTYPLVFQVRPKASFIIKNGDSIEHKMYHAYWKEDPIIIPANSMGEVKITDTRYGDLSGIYGYGCDRSGEADGVLFITK